MIDQKGSSLSINLGPNKETCDNFARMIRQIIFFENHFIEFYQNQEEKVKNKIQYIFELLKQVEIVPEKFLKHVEGTDGLFEVRVEYQSNIYRIF